MVPTSFYTIIVRCNCLATDFGSSFYRISGTKKLICGGENMEETVSLEQIFLILKKKGLFIALVTIIGVALTAGITFFVLTPKYGFESISWTYFSRDC